MLRYEDKKTLLSAYAWPAGDDLTKQLKREENDLLAILVAKETFKTDRPVDLGKFYRLVTMAHLAIIVRSSYYSHL